MSTESSGTQKAVALAKLKNSRTLTLASCTMAVGTAVSRSDAASVSELYIAVPIIMGAASAILFGELAAVAYAKGLQNPKKIDNALWLFSGQTMIVIAQLMWLVFLLIAK